MSGALCRRCGGAGASTTPYWATDGHQLCPSCCVAVAAMLDERTEQEGRDAWPKPCWTDADEEVLS